MVRQFESNTLQSKLILNKSLVKNLEGLLACDELRPQHLFPHPTSHVSRGTKDKVREVRGKPGHCVDFGAFHLSSVSSASPFICLPFFMYFSEKWQGRVLRQGPSKINMVLKCGAMKAGWHRSLTYVKFIQPALLFYDPRSAWIS